MAFFSVHGVAGIFQCTVSLLAFSYARYSCCFFLLLLYMIMLCFPVHKPGVVVCFPVHDIRVVVLVFFYERCACCFIVHDIGVFFPLCSIQLVAFSCVQYNCWRFPVDDIVVCVFL